MTGSFSFLSQDLSVFSKISMSAHACHPLARETLWPLHSAKIPMGLFLRKLRTKQRDQQKGNNTRASAGAGGAWGPRACVAEPRPQTGWLGRAQFRPLASPRRVATLAHNSQTPIPPGRPSSHQPSFRPCDPRQFSVRVLAGYPRAAHTVTYA